MSKQETCPENTPETIHALIKPETNDVVNRCSDLWVLPIEIWLFGRKEMKIVLIRCLVIIPCASYMQN